MTNFGEYGTHRGAAVAATTYNRTDGRSTSQLIRDLSEQSTRLIRQKIALARAELTERGAQARFGVGLFGGAGVLSLYGLGALTAAGILLLSTAMTAWISAVIVAGGLLVAAGAAALMGKTQLTRAVPPVPGAAIETAKQDLETIHASIREGRS